MKVWWLAAALAGSMVASAANASVTYTFKANTGQVTGGFSLTLPDFFYDPSTATAFPGITRNVSLSQLSSCQVVSAIYSGLSCTSQGFVQNNTTYSPNSNVPYDVVLFSYGSNGNPYGGDAAYYFDAGAISHAGHYDTVLLGPYQTGTLDVVQNDVPEPATWVMMVGGFGLVGSAMRRRNRPTVLA